MNKETIIKTLSTRHRATCFSITVNRTAKLLKEFKGINLRKVSTYSLQLASYGKRSPVKQAIESGEREAPKLPSYVKHAERLDNGLSFWIGYNGQEYLAMPLFGDSVRSKWILDEKEVRLEEVSHMLLASETKAKRSKSEAESEGQALFSAIKLENVESIA